MGLLVDVSKLGGNGTTNDGNTARRFLQDPTLSASITEIEETFIRICSECSGALTLAFTLSTRDTFCLHHYPVRLFSADKGRYSARKLMNNKKYHTSEV